jgi:hypothetical protein
MLLLPHDSASLPAFITYGLQKVFVSSETRLKLDYGDS